MSQRREDNAIPPFAFEIRARVLKGEQLFLPACRKFFVLNKEIRV
jgi:hypothetical protein